MAKNDKTIEKPKNRIWIIIIILLVLFVLSTLFAAFISLFSAGQSFGNVALIPIKGEITIDDTGGFLSSGVASSTEIVKSIEKAKNDESIKAVIFEINSPGGSAVASDEISQAIKDLNKTSVAWIREVGASGAYWIASSTDHIVANKMSITGSIGVIASYLEFSGLMNRYNVTYQRMVSGDYKDMGSPYKDLTNDERAILQGKINIVRDYFIDEVVSNRKMSRTQGEKLATGVFYLGSEAKDLGLIDELGGKKEAVQYLEKKLNTTIVITEYAEKKSILDVLNQLLNEKSFYLGKGISSIFTEKNFLTLKT